MENNAILLEIKEDIGEIKGEMKGMNDRLKKINGNIKHHDDKIDILETDCSKLQEAFRPIKRTYNKMTSLSFGFVILIGTIGISIIMFLKDKIKL